MTLAILRPARHVAVRLADRARDLGSSLPRATSAAGARSISASSSALVHATDAVGTFARPAVILGFWPEPRVTGSSLGHFCITATNETAMPPGGITCSALGGALTATYYGFR